MKRRKPKALDPDLADAVPTVTADYMKFLREIRDEHESDPKLFAARHSAAKTALAHIEQLMKLAGVNEDEARQQLDQHRAELDAARAEIDREEEEMPPDDAGDPG